MALILILATLVAYEPVRNNLFIDIDDDPYVTENSHVLAGLTLHGVIEAFTTTRCSNWHPLTWLSHMLDIELFGLNPAGHHFTNLLFHFLNTLLLFLVLKRMTGALWQSSFVAALFALHPLHVESVAWVAERKDMLSTCFWLLTMWAYLRYAEQKAECRASSVEGKAPIYSHSQGYLLVVFFFVLGLMSKPMLVTLPFRFALARLLAPRPLSPRPVEDGGMAPDSGEGPLFHSFCRVERCDLLCSAKRRPRHAGRSSFF